VLAQAVLLPLALAALFHWNLSDDHDWWFGFFFGSYYLGMTAAWCNRGELPRWYGLCVVAIAIAALAFEWRPRLVLALAATGLFMIGHARGWLSSWLRGPVWSYLGRHSYSLFLIHFPLCLVMNGLCATATAGRPWLALTAMFATYFTSLLAADLLSRTVDWLQTQSRRWLTAGY
jgi:peptidoglycan/LPS O-acetylase OafA/YrhL